MENKSFALYYVTTPDEKCAEELGRGAIENRLAACVNILPGMKSIYRWKGGIESAQECVLILKSRRAYQQKIFQWVKSNHPYECPCILVVAIEDGLPEYIQWLELETRPLNV